MGQDWAKGLRVGPSQPVCIRANPYTLLADKLGQAGI